MTTSRGSPASPTEFARRWRTEPGCDATEAVRMIFKLPDLGEGLSEAEIVRWHVKVGDHVDVDTPMLSVETAKAVVEVPSPKSGTIIALHAQPGDRIEIGAALVEFAPDKLDKNEASASAPADVGTVVGHMASGGEEADAMLEAANAVTRPRVRAVPAARALARSLGVDLGAVSGSGRGGLVTLDDVMTLGLPPRNAPSKMHPAATPPQLHGEEGDVEVLRSLRRAMAQSMSLARDSVMACSVFDDADLHRWGPGNDYTTRVLRAIAVAVRAEPGLNAW